MTDLQERASIEEALEIIDASLGGLTDRQLVSSTEVTDLLLDVRALLLPLPPLVTEDVALS